MNNKQTPVDFSKQLIKGKIAELIFSRMFTSEAKYTVIPFGYENVVPELMHYVNHSNDYGLLDNVRNAPDFALIDHETSKVFLVEVKYRKQLNELEVKEIASKVQDKWKQAILFVATKEGFFFDECVKIISNDSIAKLDFNLVNEETQKEHLDLLNQFIK